MSGFTTAAGVSVTQTTTSQQAPLGFQITVPTANNGNAVYTYVRAANPIPYGITCAKVPAAAAAATSGLAGYDFADLATAAMAMDRYIGVAQQVPTAANPIGGIPALHYGFVLTRGVGVAVVNSASAANDALVVHASGGQLDDAAASASNTEVGVVLGDAIGAAAGGNVYVNFAG